jgi:hypothetical protein
MISYTSEKTGLVYIQQPSALPRLKMVFKTIMMRVSVQESSAHDSRVSFR